VRPNPRGSETTAEAATAGPEPELASGAVEVGRVLNDGFERIRALIEQQNELDRFREEMVDRLHADLQSYRSDLVAKAVRPVLHSMIRLHDDVGKLLDALGREPADQVTAERLIELLAGFREDVGIALEQNGVTAFHGATEEFDPRRQTAARTIECADASLAGRVAALALPGFEHGETLLQKERVVVYAPRRSNDAGQPEG
jgi:molecular chaperone GrpE